VNYWPLDDAQPDGIFTWKPLPRDESAGFLVSPAMREDLAAMTEVLRKALAGELPEPKRHRCRHGYLGCEECEDWR
jgi:hypothetical protein